MSSLTYIPCLVLALSAVVSACNPWFPKPECSAAEDEPWSYRGRQNGPNRWGTLFPRDCNGSSQSPIDIVKSLVVKNESLGQLVLTNYNIPIPNATMVNEEGRTVQITPGDNVQRTMRVEGEEYALVQLHFHWALNLFQGSEHTIDGWAYTMEAHFVHSTPDRRIAVLGLFFQMELLNNTALQPIVNSLSDVKFKNDRTSLKSNLVLSNLLPSTPTSYYRYNGSLTTPNCTEGVIWSVLCKPIGVGELQMKEFRKLFSVTREEASEGNNNDCLMAPNFRPTQPLNGRKVYYYPSNSSDCI